MQNTLAVEILHAFGDLVYELEEIEAFGIVFRNIDASAATPDPALSERYRKTLFLRPRKR